MGHLMKNHSPGLSLGNLAYALINFNTGYKLCVKYQTYTKSTSIPDLEKSIAFGDQRM